MWKRRRQRRESFGSDCGGSVALARFWRVRARGGPYIEGGAGRLLRKGAVGGARQGGVGEFGSLRRRLSPRMCGWLREVSLRATSPAAAAHIGEKRRRKELCWRLAKRQSRGEGVRRRGAKEWVRRVGGVLVGQGWEGVVTV